MLAGLRILVIEDIGMVAMALKSMLEDIGCSVVETAARLDKAEVLARHEDLDGVLLDLNLGGQYAFSVADILRERDIPFIIMSSYDAVDFRPDLADVPQMSKPFVREPLEAMILEVICGKHKGAKKSASRSEQPSGSVTDDKQTATPRTRGELESAVCLGMCRFEQEYMGHGPREIQAYLNGTLLVVRLHGVLTVAEQRLVETAPNEEGRNLLKRVRTLLIETARPQIDSMIQVITGVKVQSLHHDISTVTGEEVMVFTLNEPPPCREVKQR
ncbi:MAG: DUF2294 family protein [Phycisphaeraceae bacterium]|nr:DUF2294 family protein [Phycisphaeraceae bacterium]